MLFEVMRYLYFIFISNRIYLLTYSCIEHEMFTPLTALLRWAGIVDNASFMDTEILKRQTNLCGFERIGTQIKCEIFNKRFCCCTYVHTFCHHFRVLNLYCMNIHIPHQYSDTCHVHCTDSGLEYHHTHLCL